MGRCLLGEEIDRARLVEGCTPLPFCSGKIRFSLDYCCGISIAVAVKGHEKKDRMANNASASRLYSSR